MTLADLDALQQFGLEGMYRLYRRLFANPGEWSWVIVGAIPDDEDFKELVARFLGIPAVASGPTFTSLTPHLPVFTVAESGCIKAAVHHGLADAATVHICFKLSSANFVKSADRLAALCAAEVAEARFLEELRIASGKTYGVSCGCTFGAPELSIQHKSPSSHIEFGCDPSSVHTCIRLLFVKLHAMVSGELPITEEELESCKEKERERLRTSDRENGSWAGRLGQAVLKVKCGSTDDPPDNGSAISTSSMQDLSLELLCAVVKDATQRSQRIENLTRESLQEKVPCLFPEGLSIEVMLLPSQPSPPSKESQEADVAEDPCSKRARTA
jgi:hypothetical protein